MIKRKKEKPPVDTFDKVILRKMLITDRAFTKNQISEATKISWNTTNKHVKSLNQKGFLKVETRHGKDFWSLNRTQKKKQKKNPLHI